METPSSTRRVTRSQAKSAINGIPMSRKNEESEKVLSRQRNGKSSALIDITNDSPIGGLAMGSLQTPSSLAKKMNLPKQTPGSGEALLRGQVKTLLQMVEEEAELSKLSFENCPFLHLRNPLGILAPTPTNTPNVLNLSSNGDNSLASVAISEVEEESKIPHQVVVVMPIDGSKQETLESEKSLITRTLLFDFSDKSEISDGSVNQDKSTEDDEVDSASVWSIQVNASSTQDEDDEEEIKEEDYEEQEEDVDYEEGEDGGLVDELCQGLSKISVREKGIPEFEGKRTRFVYNSNDEIEGVEDVKEAVSPSILCLKGMPKPEGKHLRFSDDEELED